MKETTNVRIRAERVTDYPEIGALQARAFGNRPGEALIVILLRQRRAFDPELSLVAEGNGRVVGHALFSPHKMRLLDQTVPTVNLAPIAVEPTSQGQGIGGQGLQSECPAWTSYLLPLVSANTRIHTNEPTRPHVFLARDHEAARAMVAAMAHTLQSRASGTEYILPLHPFSASAGAFGQASATSIASPAGMACSLGSGPLDDYFVQVREGQRPAGRPLWPVAFDLG